MKKKDTYYAAVKMPDFDDLKEIVDNGTTHITIPTPKGWKCKRKNCKADYKHTHGTYAALSLKK